MKGQIKLLDRTGHSVIAEWNPEDRASVKVASEQLNKLLGLGHWAYKVNMKTGEKSQLKTFDPTAEEILVHPQMIGG